MSKFINDIFHSCYILFIFLWVFYFVFHTKQHYTFNSGNASATPAPIYTVIRNTVGIPNETATVSLKLHIRDNFHEISLLVCFIILLSHWGRVTHICVIKLTIIGSDNCLLPGRRQAIIWTNAGILLIGPLRTNLIEILIEIQTFSFKKMHLKMSSVKWRPFCLGLNVLMSMPSSGY